jgi:hypothetical protein
MPRAATAAVEDAIAQAVDGPDGYWVGPLLTETEVATLRSLIRQQFLARIGELAPNAVADFAAAGLGQYHRQSHRIDHASAWPRHARLMGPEAVEFFQQTSLMRRIVDEFGSAEITNEVEGGAPELVWRLVRPGEGEDVGPLHADRWFWDINGWPIPQGKHPIKVWFLLHGTPGRAGLRVAPGSHRETHWTYRAERRHGMTKPVFDEAASGIATVLLPTPPGHGVVFSYDLLHGGAPTGGDECRVSIEATLFVPNG